MQSPFRKLLSLGRRSRTSRYVSFDKKAYTWQVCKPSLTFEKFHVLFCHLEDRFWCRMFCLTLGARLTCVAVLTTGISCACKVTLGKRLSIKSGLSRVGSVGAKRFVTQSAPYSVTQMPRVNGSISAFARVRRRSSRFEAVY